MKISQSQRWIFAAIAVGALFIGAYTVLRPFLASIAWAGVLAYATWPVYRFMLARTRDRRNLCASLMTALLFFAVAVPVVTGSWLLGGEVRDAIGEARRLAGHPQEVVDGIKRVPIVGDRAASYAARILADPASVQRLVLENAASLQGVVLHSAGTVGRNLVKVLFTLMTVFFFYRNGEEIIAQVRTVVHLFTGDTAQDRLHTVGATVRAVVYGLLLTALAQGILAALGYYVAGVPAPMLLGSATGFLALLPFGAPLAWVPACIWVFLNKSIWMGMALLLWSFFCVSGIDNVLRPYFISGATRIPYVLVFFGVLGGLGAFGLIGLFIGPVFLAVLVALWQEWAQEVVAAAEPAVVANAGSAPTPEEAR
ncbi:MAG: AI-2E family transporter [Candidatus Schekmanbacteria bacterium]|nr:AI-2E family transporter [Candidatus Schekmanbacteria bacterium]